MLLKPVAALPEKFIAKLPVSPERDKLNPKLPASEEERKFATILPEVTLQPPSAPARVSVGWVAPNRLKVTAF
jgi:hypothetical protein